MQATTINGDSLKNSLAVSAGLHIALLLFLYFGLPVLIRPLPSHHEPVPFEIVEIADITNTRVKQPEEPEKPPAPPPVPEQKTQATPPTPPKIVEKVEAIPLPKPAEKPKPPPPQEKPKDESFARLLKDISKLKPQEAAKPADAKPDARQTAQTEQKSLAPALSNKLTITEEDALRRQISQCWNMPIGARDAQNLIVEVIIDVNPDRTVQHAEVVDQSRMNSDSFFRAAAEAALRALYNPQCSPLLLPEGKYDEWKRIDFTFDPRDML